MGVEQYEVESGYECPTCDRILNTSVGLKQHHTKVHDESLVETSECDWCGKTFKVKPSQEGNFCSRECFGKDRSENGVPERKRRVMYPCEECGQLMELQKSEVGHKVYCSRECRNDGEYLNCELCGDEFYAYDTYVDNARFCSQDCYGIWLSKNKSGADSWHWKGGGDCIYGRGWTERKREQVRKRDRRRCTACGLQEQAHLDEHDMKLHVHHMVDARQSTNPAVYNAMRNLRALCISCHLERH